MISLSSAAHVVRALGRAHDISFTAYTLPPGPVLDALVGAAASGAHVRVRLEGYIYKDDGAEGINAKAVTRLSGAGADAFLVHGSADSADPIMHLKSAIVDGTLYLDDRNWPADGEDTIVRDSSKADARMVEDAASGAGDVPTALFAVRKRDALASEARLANEARPGEELVLESESFGAGNRVYSAVDRAAKRGVRVRVLVSSREIKNDPRERAAIARLRKDGVAVRACDADEKFAVLSNGRGWIGSANVSAAFNIPDQLDWGLRTGDEAILGHLRAAFESRWRAASSA